MTKTLARSILTLLCLAAAAAVAIFVPEAWTALAEFAVIIAGIALFFILYGALFWLIEKAFPGF